MIRYIYVILVDNIWMEQLMLLELIILDNQQNDRNQLIQEYY